MTDALDGAILDALDRATAPMNAVQIADVTGIHHESIQYALHRLDDDGHVLLKIGRYRLSEAERKRRGEDAPLNHICDERKDGPFVSVTLETLDGDAAQEVGA